VVVLPPTVHFSQCTGGLPCCLQAAQEQSHAEPGCISS